MYIRLRAQLRLFLIVLNLFIFLFIIVPILIETGQYFKCPSCQPSNLTSKPMSLFNITNNTEDEQTSLDDYSIWCLDMAHRLDNEQRLPQSPILRAPSINSTKLNRLPYRYSQWKSSPILPRRVTPCEHSLMMRLLMIIERVCRKHKIPFMIYYGTLLGSWRHHDIVPWDDDLDLMISIDDRTRFLQAINQTNATIIERYDFHSHELREYDKIYFRHTPSAGGYPWNFPYVDVFLYQKNDTHLWQSYFGERMTKLEYIFPLVMRPLGELWLPAPRYPERIFASNIYDECKDHYWDHKNELPKDEKIFKCNDFKHIYPFVEQNKRSKSIEILKTNNTIIHTIKFG